jgi:hypothetical protein
MAGDLAAELRVQKEARDDCEHEVMINGEAGS